MPTTTGLTIPFTGLRKQYNSLRNEILDVTDEVLRSGVLMNGNYTAEFENWLAKKNSVSYAVTCHSGTQALEIIAAYNNDLLRTAWDNPRPTVAVPAMTYPATLNAFIRTGWQVVIVDTDRYGQMDVTKIPGDPDAICVIGLYGQSTNRTVWNRNWNSKQVFIEDGAQHWLADDCRRESHACAISFDPMKNLACYGNGGAVVTNNIHLMEYARAWRDNGKSNHAYIGTNSRMSEADCAQMLVKLKYFDEWQERRSHIAEYYAGELSEFVDVISPGVGVESAWHKFVIRLSERHALKHHLAIKGIETRYHYDKPLFELPVGWDFVDYAKDPYRGAVSFSRECLSLPIYPEMTDSEVTYVIESILEFLR